METPNQIQLTEKDKERYRKEIEAIDINIESFGVPPDHSIVIVSFKHNISLIGTNSKG